MKCPVCERPITDMSCVCGYDETADFVRHRTVSLLGAQDIFNRRVLERMAMLEAELERLKKSKAAENEKPKSEPKAAVFDYTPKSIVTFGRYEQGNGVEPLEWIVLKSDNRTAMLISKYAIDCCQYGYYQSTSNSWSTSSLRYWLNSDFLKAAFTDSERERICATLISNENNTTSDKVFILSAYEVMEYLNSIEERSCKATEYAKSRGAYVNSEGASWWWLRDPTSDDKISIVDATGEIFEVGSPFPISNGAYPTSTMGTVRPVLYMKL